MLTIPIFTDNAFKSKEFYCDKMQFNLIGPAPKKENSHFLTSGPVAGISFHIKPAENRELKLILNKEGYWLTFDNFNVTEMFNKINNKIREFSGPVEELPPETHSGLLDCPGGLYILINDPFGNTLIFNEW